MAKILFFLAAGLATEEELATIAALNAAALPAYEVEVLNSLENAEYGDENRLIPCDFVAGTIPEDYEGVDVFDVDAIPVTVADADSITVRNSASSASTVGTANIVDGEVEVMLPATRAIAVSGLLAGIVVSGSGTALTLTVANGVITAAALS